MSTIATQRPLRIAIATPNPSAYSETFIAAHIRRLVGVKCILVDGDLPNRVLDGPLLLHRGGNGQVMDHVLARLAGGTTQDLLRKRIAKLMAREGIDVMLAEYGVCANALIEPCARAGVPLVAHFHGYDAHKESTLEETGRYARLFHAASALVVVSRAMEQQLLALGAPREKVLYNCYGIDVDQFQPCTPETNAPHFVAVGRFVEKKAPHLVLSAFQRLLVTVPDARMTMVGQGPLWESCAQRVRAEGFGDQVDLIGVKPYTEVAAIMGSARAFVQHSVRAASGDSEGTPLAVLEAMATGLPVIATRHTGIADVVAHAERGLLCDEYDIGTMARHMEQVSLDPALAGRMGRAGRTYVEQNHRVQDSVAALQAILQRAASAPRA
ncbi:MAG: glycosyltransferase [Flavobacteriales bacterium]|nr:glycosyltransferase [Flavobacteriales bacterium]